jgi:hypothetical protein
MKSLRRALATAVAAASVATAGLVALTPQAASAADACGAAAVARSTGTYAWVTLFSGSNWPLCAMTQARIWRYTGSLNAVWGPLGGTSNAVSSAGYNAGNDFRWGNSTSSLSPFRSCPVNYMCFSDGNRYPA